ncbi:MAG: hypothetical protein M3Q06_01720, partial [Bacteroidota bacterium]|nr:hypothetical protein [Bacteroidota bacterium]
AVMKAVLFGFLFLLIRDFAASAQEAAIVVVQPGSRVGDVLTDSAVYAYPLFLPGVITYRNGKSKEALLNYNAFLDEMQTIQKNDTIALNKLDVQTVIIQNDTFGRDQFFYRVERDYDKMRLASRKVFALISRVPAAGDTSRYKLRYSVLNNGRFLKDIAPVDTLRLAVFDMFYIVNVKNVVLPVHHNTLIELYPHKKKALLEYLAQRSVNFYDKDAVTALLDFVVQKNFN